jgi:hypothetical protein
MDIKVTSRLGHRDAPFLHQPHRLKLALAATSFSAFQLAGSVKHLISLPTKPAAGHSAVRHVGRDMA